MRYRERVLQSTRTIAATEAITSSNPGRTDHSLQTTFIDTKLKSPPLPQVSGRYEDCPWLADRFRCSHLDSYTSIERSQHTVYTARLKTFSHKYIPKMVRLCHSSQMLHMQIVYTCETLLRSTTADNQINKGALMLKWLTLKGYLISEYVPSVSSKTKHSAAFRLDDGWASFTASESISSLKTDVEQSTNFWVVEENRWIHSLSGGGNSVWESSFKRHATRYVPKMSDTIQSQFNYQFILRSSI